MPQRDKPEPVAIDAPIGARKRAELAFQAIAETNELSLLVPAIWSALNVAVSTRKTSFHTPMVASVDGDGAPHVRVMVLRGVDAIRRCIQFNCDERSAKRLDMRPNAPMAVTGYDAAMKQQIRLEGDYRPMSEHDASAAWEVTKPMSRRCYLADPGPGSALEMPGAGLPPELIDRSPTPEESAPAQAFFHPFHIEITSIDWLYLAHSGHRRAQFRWDGTDWNGNWSVP
ncbi:MAG: pyridoxamine 5'-phosphate oxidase family protein [Pseudomonadota bacterium]